MEVQVEAADEEGHRRAYVGIEICRGPGVLRVLLTRPFGVAGETVDVPLQSVESITEIHSGVLGDPVRSVRDDQGEGR